MVQVRVIRSFPYYPYYQATRAHDRLVSLTPLYSFLARLLGESETLPFITRLVRSYPLTNHHLRQVVTYHMNCYVTTAPLKTDNYPWA